jgi:hypothetical protein
MLQVAAPILNEIARTQTLETDWARKLFAMSQQELNEQDQAQYKSLVQAGIDRAVAIAYQAIAPLLAENEAISRYIEETGSLELRSCLPEVTTTEEALILATEEYLLDPTQQAQLRGLLEGLSR